MQRLSQIKLIFFALLLLSSSNNNYNMSKRKFTITTQDKLTHLKTQNFASLQAKRPRDFLVPIEKVGKRHGKSLRSQGKAIQKDTKLPLFDLLTFKQTFVVGKDKDTFNLKSIRRKVSHSNRVNTEKIGAPYASAQKKDSRNKILIHGGGYSKQISPQRNNYFKDQAKVLWKSERVTQVQQETKESPQKIILQKKLTAFEREEIKHYEPYYIGLRRISGLQDFTDGQGDPKVTIGDSIAYKYQIMGNLGRGSFGRVYKAFDHKKKELIALKIIKNQQKFNVQARVQIEILETVILHDPKLRNNIVRLKGSFKFRGHTCLKFQILSKNLYEFIKQNNFLGFSLDLIRRFAIQILQALNFFSRFGIIHCDLKPQNILLKEQNKSGIKVIDVGSGCFDGKQIYTYIQSRFYRAPEIVLGVKYSAAIDIWSFGCILVELYSGIPLFPGQNQNEQMLMFIQLLGVPPVHVIKQADRRKKFFAQDYSVRIPPVKKKDKIKQVMNWNAILGPDCDKTFLELVKRCLSWDPSERITAKEALAHEWIISGLPKTIRAQHIEQLNSN